MLTRSSSGSTFGTASGPIRDDWNNGNYGEAVGRVGAVVIEAVVGSKGLSKLGAPLTMSLDQQTMSPEQQTMSLDSYWATPMISQQSRGTSARLTP